MLLFASLATVSFSIMDNFELITTQYPIVIYPVAPQIDKNALEDLIVKAGQPIRWELPIVAAPKPKVSWKVNNKNVDERSINMQFVLIFLHGFI